MPQTTTVTSGTQSIPDELLPYFTDEGALLPQAQQVFGRDYASAYGNALNTMGLEGAGRIAGLSNTEVAAGQQIAGLQQPGQFGQATGAINQGLGTLGGMTNAAQTQAYMSPYIQDVLNVNKDEAYRDAQKQLVGANLASSRQGTYGGARNMLAQTEADRNLQQQMAKIQATGMQSAFDSAQKAQLGAATQYGQFGTQLGTLGGQQQSSDLGRATALGAYGGTERAVAQQQLDAQYQDQMKALNFPAEQLGSMANLLRGVPLGDTSGTQTTTTPAP